MNNTSLLAPLKLGLTTLLELKVPMNLTHSWSYGSSLAIMYTVQVMTGFFMSFFYSNNMSTAFMSVVITHYSIIAGSALHYSHINGASIIFILMYLHVGRSLLFQSWSTSYAWGLGGFLYLLTMGTAFLGYVLPWGQMSFWGATVITNLISTVPYVGTDIVSWAWGGYTVGGATLTRFYSLHFLMPLGGLGLIGTHLMALHLKGSSNPLGATSVYSEVYFHPYFSGKDMIGASLMLMLLSFLLSFEPNLLGDPDNFSESNSMVTPVHIQPEWYFLYAYAILRSVPNKLGGVVLMLMSFIMVGCLSLTGGSPLKKNAGMSLVWECLVYVFIFVVLNLTWMGGSVASYPFTQMSGVLSGLYFMCLLLMGSI